MDQGILQRLLGSLRQPAGPTGAADDDAQLLRRFLTHQDANAFELLLWRHGPMVLGVCRRLLPSAHDAEDAFQATFLALVKKGRSIAAGGALGGWLYRVAYRVALRLRTALLRRTQREQPGVEELPAPSTGEPPGHDLRAVIDEEIERLPARHRAAFVLCCVEGKTGAEAARELGCAPGTVSSRVTRARARLRHRLARRGLAPSAGVAAALAGEGWAAPVPAGLVSTSLQAARLFAMGAPAGGALSRQAVTLTEGVLRAMALTRYKLVALVLLLLGSLVGGAFLTRSALTAAQDAPPGQEGPAKEKKPREGRAVVQVVKPLPGGVRWTVTERCTVEAFQQEDLFPAVAGVLKQLTVDIGDRVKKGQLLAEIDAPLLVLDERQAAVGVKQAKGQTREAEARIATAQAEVQAARTAVTQREAELRSARATLDFQQNSYERAKKLYELKTVDAKFVEEKAAQMEAARGQVGAATAAVASSKADVAVKQGKVAQGEAALETARFNLESAEIALEKAQYTRGLTRIVSPVDGVVTRRNYQSGRYLRPGESGGRPLLTVQRTDLMRVVVGVPGRAARLVEPGMPVEVGIDALPNDLLPSKVSRIGFALDEKTGTMRVEIDVPNPRGLLRPGMTGVVALRLQNKTAGALHVPASAVTPLPDGKRPGGETHGVYVVRDGKAHLTPTRLGAAAGRDVEILSGVLATDRIVVDASALQGDAIPVEVREGPGRK